MSSSMSITCRLLPLLALALLSREVDGQAGKKKPLPQKTDVKVTLRFSVAELDPKEPGDSYIECIVANKRDAAIQVPTAYVGGYQDQVMVLHSGPLHLVHWAAEKKPKSVRLEPGKEVTVFKASLQELLLDPALKKALQPTERRYYWSWDH